MQIQDGTGKHKTEIGKANKVRIKAFFKKYPNSTKTECSKAIGLSKVTVWRHIKAIQASESGH